jgi:thiamine biosynthesis lipoprotein
VIEVMEIALKISEQTDGAMDVTVSPLIDLWGFGSKGRISSPPSDAVIAEAMSRCGWRKIEVKHEPPMLRKVDADIEINLSTLVEGYAADELAKLLSAHGCERFLIDVGGAIVAHGQTWNVGVQTPGAAQGEAMTSVPLRDMAVTTAGIYRKHFESGGVSYPHILDPHTGRPIGTALSSVSVFNERAVIADGWDTALMVLGAGRGRALAAKLGLRAVFVERGD